MHLYVLMHVAARCFFIGFVCEMAGHSTGLIAAQLCSQFVSEMLHVFGGVSDIQLWITTINRSPH